MPPTQTQHKPDKMSHHRALNQCTAIPHPPLPTTNTLYNTVKLGTNNSYMAGWINRSLTGIKTGIKK